MFKALYFFWFLLWAQWLLIKDCLQAVITKKFHCRTIEEKLVKYLKIHLHNINPLQRTIEPTTRIVFANHRSFTDFFLDSYIIGGGANLARYMVAVILPAVWFYSICTGRGVFFHRGKTKRSLLAKKILAYVSRYSQPLIVYPEGTRHQGLTPIPLRHGVMKIVYENNLPCQIMLASGKENILNEKQSLINYNQNCNFFISQQIIPKEFDSYEKFNEHIMEIWQTIWSTTLQKPD